MKAVSEEFEKHFYSKDERKGSVEDLQNLFHLFSLFYVFVLDDLKGLDAIIQKSCLILSKHCFQLVTICGML